MYTVAIVRKIWTAVQKKKTDQRCPTTSLAQFTNDNQLFSEGTAADSSDSDENIPLNRLCKIKKEPQFQQGHISSDSEDNIPLKTLSDKTRKRKYHDETVSDETDFDDDMVDKDFVIEKDDIPSSDSNLSDINIPVIDIPKHRKKWFRKRSRPLKRKIAKPTLKQPISRSSKSYSQRMYEATQKSKRQHKLYQILKKSHDSRLSNLLQGNHLRRHCTSADGDCFFNAVSIQLMGTITTTELRQNVCNHVLENENHYKGYLQYVNSKTEEEKSQYFKQKVNELSNEGVWNNEIADLTPLAVANIYQVPITIYSSKLERPVVKIDSDQNSVKPIDDLSEITLAYLAVPGFEHYDAALKLVAHSSPKKSGINTCSDTPVKIANASEIHEVATPRKSASFRSPPKEKRTRKRQSNPNMWKKNIRKALRNTGKEYISPSTKKTVEAKFVKPSNCTNCRYKCAENVTESIRENLFESFYDQSMTYERKRDFICRHVLVKATSKRYAKTYKHNSRSYFLPVGNTLQRVCKQFFLRTLDVSDKMIRCTLARKVHGSFEGTDRRGKHTPVNKTPEDKTNYIKSHIESFPVMQSHYKRKDTQRQFLSQDLSINKMYELYKIKCQEDGVQPASQITYRRVFCSQYNYSFHKPKKDSCEQCNAYQEKEKASVVTDADKERQQDHLNSKDRARQEKEIDKQRAKVDKSLFAATFDLEAVLYTPCSTVSQIFYKRKLACYNLSVYDLGTKDGTCYLWDESQGARGSAEIGSCLLTHLESLPNSIKHVILYSDCCAGQNRNQYIAASLLYAVKYCRQSNINVIEQKFLESGHTQMECDSMHAAIEHAKRRTAIYIPSQWDTVVHMARKKKPYTVVPLRFNQFYDLHKLTKENYGNFKVATDGARVNWTKIKVLRFEKNAENEIQFKYSYNEEAFSKINVSKKLKRGERQSTCTISLSKKYFEKRPVSMEKKADLISLCNNLVVPALYRPYYEALSTNKTTKDCLPMPDCLEEDIDSE